MTPRFAKRVISEKGQGVDHDQKKDGSSQESVGQFWLREVAEAVIQGEFEGICCSVSIGPMAYHLSLVVEALHCAIGDSHMEVVEDLLLMVSDHPGEFSHGV